jgi:glycosyltransferase involved in cell wall biosynthesis
MNHELMPHLYENEWGHWLRRQYREYIRRATRIIAVSNKTKHDVVQIYGVDANLIDVVHLAADTTTFYPAIAGENWSPPARPYVLFVGGRYWYKSLERLLEAFRRLPDPEMELVLAGDLLSAHELDLVRQRGLENRVRVALHPSGEELRRLYIGCFAFVHHSLHEGFGIPLLEAMACGAPVAASDIEVFHEVSDSAAEYFDPTNPDAIAAAILAIGDPTRREQLVARGTDRVAQFSWDRCARATLAAYEAALAS